eukprot:1157634-Pelagomonas_calceolata.AAC.13
MHPAPRLDAPGGPRALAINKCRGRIRVRSASTPPEGPFRWCDSSPGGQPGYHISFMVPGNRGSNLSFDPLWPLAHAAPTAF